MTRNRKETGKKIHCDRSNIYDIFKRTCIDTDLIYRISVVLNTDFFAYYSAHLKARVPKLSAA